MAAVVMFVVALRRLVELLKLVKLRFQTKSQRAFGTQLVQQILGFVKRKACDFLSAEQLPPQHGYVFFVQYCTLLIFEALMAHAGSMLNATSGILASSFAILE